MSLRKSVVGAGLGHRPERDTGAERRASGSASTSSAGPSPEMRKSPSTGVEDDDEEVRVRPKINPVRNPVTSGSKSFTSLLMTTSSMKYRL